MDVCPSRKIRLIRRIPYSHWQADLMAGAETTSVSSRKQPRQQRSAALVSAVLDAAVQVLTREGTARFTTARVAERAGVSVGSLYQYFPNKAAILFRLQSDEWRQTSQMLRGILEDRTLSPPARLRALVHAFLRSECDEAAVRGALNDAAPLYRDAAEAVEIRAASAGIVETFMREALPDAPEPVRILAADLIKSTIREVGASFSATPRTPDEIHAYAEALADMFDAYLHRLMGTATGG
jgi:AcrR family transcriptional regulator